jgi:predicted secreted Zn-dependent protease
MGRIEKHGYARRQAVLAAIVIAFPLMFAVSAAASEKSAGAAGATEGDRNSVLQPKINEKVEYYDITGECEKDLSSRLKENGCPAKDGRRYHSLTSWDFTWDYNQRKTEHGCTTDSFQPVIEINVRYPRWQKTGTPPPALVEKWERFMNNLKTHENEHVAMVVEAASDVTVAVMKLPPQPNCVTLDQEIRKIIRFRIKRLNDDSCQYDLETRHGTKQGAVFP